MPGFQPPPHGVVAVGILSRREDADAWSGLGSLCCMVRGVGSQHTHAQPQHTVSPGKQRARGGMPTVTPQALWHEMTGFLMTCSKAS